jgi:hypothetical protein
MSTVVPFRDPCAALTGEARARAMAIYREAAHLRKFLRF